MSDETIPQMRERIETLEKSLKSEQSARSEAEAKARLFEVKDVFREQGYNPTHAELYVSANPNGDVTAESISEFAGKYGLAPVRTETTEGKESTTDGGADGSKAQSQAELNTFSRAGSGAGDGSAAGAGDEPMSRESWEELNRTDRAAAHAALQQGKVQIRKDNPYVER